VHLVAVYFAAKNALLEARRELGQGDANFELAVPATVSVRLEAAGINPSLFVLSD
jgi:hypothetical protein